MNGRWTEGPGKRQERTAVCGRRTRWRLQLPATLNPPFCLWDAGAARPVVLPALPTLPRRDSQPRAASSLPTPRAAPARQPGPAPAPAPARPPQSCPETLGTAQWASLLTRLPSAFSQAGRSGLWGGPHASPLFRWSSPTAESKKPGPAHAGLWGSECMLPSHGHGLLGQAPGGTPRLPEATCRDRVCGRRAWASQQSGAVPPTPPSLA